MIVNKSRAEWRSMATSIPIQISDYDKIPKISEEIKSFLRSNPKVFLGTEGPYCYLSRIESSFAELNLGCNLKKMVDFSLPVSNFINVFFASLFCVYILLLLSV